VLKTSADNTYYLPFVGPDALLPFFFVIEHRPSPLRLRAYTLNHCPELDTFYPTGNDRE
jgi:hypothetical protein